MYIVCGVVLCAKHQPEANDHCNPVVPEHAPISVTHKFGYVVRECTTQSM